MVIGEPLHIPASNDNQQAVIVEIAGIDEPGIKKLRTALARKLQSSAGEVDGYDLGDEGGRIFIYGPSADELWAEIEAALRKFRSAGKIRVMLRYGPDGEDSEEKQIVLRANAS